MCTVFGHFLPPNAQEYNHEKNNLQLYWKPKQQLARFFFYLRIMTVYMSVFFPLLCALEYHLADVYSCLIFGQQKYDRHLSFSVRNRVGWSSDWVDWSIHIRTRDLGYTSLWFKCTKGYVELCRKLVEDVKLLMTRRWCWKQVERTTNGTITSGYWLCIAFCPTDLLYICIKMLHRDPEKYGEGHKWI